MKRLVCAMVAVLGIGAMAAEEELSWDRQLYEMGWHIMYTSTLNLINGLQLTEEQATKLRALAVEQEKNSFKAPALAGKFSPRWQPVRDAYREVESCLIKGEDVPKAVEQRMGKARALEADAIRESLIKTSSARNCADCHGNPADRAVGAPLLNRSDFNAKSAAVAHMAGPYGLSAFLKLHKAANEVEKILTPAQLAVTSDFSCCITPPKNLQDPTRVGQAAVTEGKLELFKFVRGVPDSRWEFTRKFVVKKMENVLSAAYPGMPPAQRAAMAEKGGQALDKARKLSDVDYELEKEKLAEEIDSRTQLQKSQPQSEVKPAFRAAMFLLLPGATPAYDALLERLKKAKDAPVAQTDLNKIEGADTCKDGSCALKGEGNLQPKK